MKMAGRVPGGGRVGAGAGRLVGTVTAASLMAVLSWKAADKHTLMVAQKSDAHPN